ncbi:hypothetical protein N2152v2_009100 [Parachlorella kessleri]
MQTSKLGLSGSMLASNPVRTPAMPRRCHRRPVVTRAVAEPPTAVPFLSTADHLQQWAPNSWRKLTALQQPAYPNQDEVRKAYGEIASYPPLVFAGECRTLQERLALCARGEAFMLQGGDCAESFTQFSANSIRDLFRVILQMSVVMTFGGGVPVVKIGRIAGQFAKPRSSDMEKHGDIALPSYRGDIINGPEFTPEARVPNPMRLVRAYNQSAASLNLLRGFASGGYAALDRVTKWNLDFMQASKHFGLSDRAVMGLVYVRPAASEPRRQDRRENSDEGKAYLDLAKRVDEAIQFMMACGMDKNSPIFKETEFYVSHECLLMEYEEALTREDSTTGLWYGCSGHFLWCGERTRQLNNSHVEFMRGLGNPIGVKVSDKMDPSELVALIATLNPENTPGRLAVIVRMGASKLRKNMPGLVEAVQQAGQVVTWVCDPMHGNTEDCQGVKTRRYDNIRAEVEAFFDVHDEMGSVPGGLHLEMTGDNVTECLGGGAGISELDLNSRYHSHCDPRLNAEQALEMAFYAASRLRQRKERLAAAEQAGQLQPVLLH